MAAGSSEPVRQAPLVGTMLRTPSSGPQLQASKVCPCRSLPPWPSSLKQSPGPPPRARGTVLTPWSSWQCHHQAGSLVGRATLSDGPLPCQGPMCTWRACHGLIPTVRHRDTPLEPAPIVALVAMCGVGRQPRRQRTSRRRPGAQGNGSMTHVSPAAAVCSGRHLTVSNGPGMCQERARPGRVSPF